MTLTPEDRAALAEAVQLLAARSDAEGLSIIPRADGGLDIRLHDRALYLTLDQLSDRLPGNPSIKVLKKTCREIGVRVGRIGAKPCVSVEAFKRAMERASV